MAQDNIVVVALGGNAISKENQEGNVAEQFENSRATAKQLADLVEQGYQLVTTHGNGPQIGNFLLRNEAARDLIYPLAMEVAVAHVQGGMGFMIAQTLTNELAHRGHDRVVTALITTILVDHQDPSFSKPAKPIGRVMTQAEAEERTRGEGWTMREVQPGKFRRVVPSPMPRTIMEMSLIRRAVEAGELIVTCGGGGVPVIRDSSVGLRGVAAVIDKDHASALLAAELNAGALVILTAVDRVCINFGRPDQRAVERMTVAEARRWFAEGQFPPGSMGPKIQAAIRFLEQAQRPDARAVIGPLEQAADALAGKTGTTITK
jgi:carbamate kinase